MDRDSIGPQGRGASRDEPAASPAEPGPLGAVEQTRDGATIRIHVVPGSSRSAVEIRGSEIRVRVRAPAERGKATREALKTLGEWLDLAPSKLAVASGPASRSKRVAVVGETVSDLRKRVEAALRRGR